MKLRELARILKLDPNTVTRYAREGKYKTAKKVIEDHREVWYIDDSEVEKIINLK